MTRVKGVDGTDPRSLSAGEIEARRQIGDIHRYLVEYVPGFEKAHFTKAAPFLGIRETRRIVGQYVMNRDDILSCRRFDDAIAVGSYPIDLHRPNDTGCTLEWCGDCYDIPYRSLVPQKHRQPARRRAAASRRPTKPWPPSGSCPPAWRWAKPPVALPRSPWRKECPRHDVNVAKLREELVARGAYLRS